MRKLFEVERYRERERERMCVGEIQKKDRNNGEPTLLVHC